MEEKMCLFNNDAKIGVYNKHVNRQLDMSTFIHQFM